MSTVACVGCGAIVPRAQTEITGRGLLCSTCAARAEIDALAGTPARTTSDAERRLQRVLRRTIYIGLASLAIAAALAVAGFVTWRGRVARDEEGRKRAAPLEYATGFDSRGGGTDRKSTRDDEFPRVLIVLIAAFGGGGASLVAYALRQRR